ncbi:hypothetical protein UPYG_G00074330 [Umbra pygmaea]|uniref:Recombination activating protein 2 n=1 Tax=Umbra pygmaea TaxID=75934 RepID=A0ABD0XFX3_UMBPY
MKSSYSSPASGSSLGSFYLFSPLLDCCLLTSINSLEIIPCRMQGPHSDTLHLSYPRLPSFSSCAGDSSVAYISKREGDIWRVMDEEFTPLDCLLHSANGTEFA